MFKRTALFALAAAAVIGLSALVSSVAEARPHGGGMGGGGGHRVGGGGGHHHVHRGHVHRGHGHHHRRHGHHHRHHHHHRRHVHFHRHCHLHRHGRHFHRHCHGHGHWHWRARFVAAAPVYAATRPVAATCTCLVKEYLPNNVVLFRDVCTNEYAMNPPAQSAAEAPPQGS